jgi:hypothetical protein
MKTDENAENVTPVRIHRRLAMRMTEEELNMNKETVRQILSTNLNTKNYVPKLCQ